MRTVREQVHDTHPSIQPPFVVVTVPKVPLSTKRPRAGFPIKRPPWLCERGVRGGIQSRASRRTRPSFVESVHSPDAESAFYRRWRGDAASRREVACIMGAVIPLWRCYLPHGRPQLRRCRSPGQRCVVATACGDGSYATERLKQMKGEAPRGRATHLPFWSSSRSVSGPFCGRKGTSRVFNEKAHCQSTATHTLSIFSGSTTKTARPLLQIAPWIEG